MELGDHVEVLRQGTVADKACTLLCADHMPRAVEVLCQSTLIRSPRWTRVPRQNLQFVGQTPIGLVGLQGRTGRTARRAVQELGTGLALVQQVRSDGWHVCLTSMAGENAKRLASPCRRRGRSTRPHQCEVAADNPMCESRPGCSPRRRKVVTGCPGVAGLAEWSGYARLVENWTTPKAC